jgi:hypothetical protein
MRDESVGITWGELMTAVLTLGIVTFLWLMWPGARQAWLPCGWGNMPRPVQAPRLLVGGPWPWPGRST